MPRDEDAGKGVTFSDAPSSATRGVAVSGERESKPKTKTMVAPTASRRTALQGGESKDDPLSIEDHFVIGTGSDEDNDAAGAWERVADRPLDDVGQLVGRDRIDQDLRSILLRDALDEARKSTEDLWVSDVLSVQDSTKGGRAGEYQRLAFIQLVENELDELRAGMEEKVFETKMGNAGEAALMQDRAALEQRVAVLWGSAKANAVYTAAQCNELGEEMDAFMGASGERSSRPPRGRDLSWRRTR